MSTTATSSGRRIIAALAATTLAAIGLAAATQSSAEGAALVQKVNVSVSTGGGTVYTNTSVRAEFTLANPATNTGNVDVFSIVVPSGVTGVAIGGASGPVGSVWRQALLPCGTRANCSKILLVYPASFPLSKSFLRPGQSMLASVLFNTTNTTGTLPFNFIGIGNGVFTAASTPSITVVSGDAADYAVTGDATLKAGVAGNYAFHAQNASNLDVPFAGGKVTFTLGVSDATPIAPVGAITKLTYNNVDYPLLTDATHPLPYTEVTFPSSGTFPGVYPFTLTLNKAGGNSIAAGAPTKVPPPQSLAQQITVNAADATSVTLVDVTDAGTPPSPDLSAGKPFTASFTLADQFGNPALLASQSQVTFSALGTKAGTLTQEPIVGPDYGTSPKPGTIRGSWSTADPAVTFKLSLAGAPDSTKQKAVVPTVTTQVVDPTVPTTVGTGPCDPTSPLCGSASFPSSTTNTAPFTVSVGVNFCTANDPCTLNQPQIISVTGSFIFDRAVPASATVTCSGDPTVAGACPRVPKYKTVTYYHWTDSVDHDFDCIATAKTGCTTQSTTPSAPNGCLIKVCDQHDIDATPSDNEVLLEKVDRTEQVFDGWLDDKLAYPKMEAQASGVASAPWLRMPDCIVVNGNLQLPAAADAIAAGQSDITCVDKTSSASYVRASDAVNAPLTVVWQFVGDPRTHTPAA